MPSWNGKHAECKPSILATVRAGVVGSTPPSFDDVGQALYLLRLQHHKIAETPPRMAAAMCAVAESIGDGNMLQRCTEDLERTAPQYPPTLQARAALNAVCPPARFWAGWLAIALACAVTAVDALRRGSRAFVRGVRPRASPSRRPLSSSSSGSPARRAPSFRRLPPGR